MRWIGILLLLAAASLQLAFAGTSGPSPIPSPPSWAINTTATAVCKGTVNYIPVTITNRGSPYQQGASNLSGTTMQSVQLGVTGSKTLYPIGTVSIGNIKPGASATANVPMFIVGNASLLLSPQITLNYYYYSLYSDSEVANITVSTKICSAPLEISVSPEVLTAGTIQNVTINLTNTATIPLNSISLRFSIPGADGAWLSQQPIQIASLAPNQTISLNKNAYVAGNQSDQSVPLNVSVIFYNGSKVNQIYENLEILASGLVALSPSGFTLSPSMPSPSSVFSISFILTDTGTAGASALTATPLPPRGFTAFGSNSVFVGSVSADSQTPVTLSLLASNSVKPGTYKIPIRLNYLNNLRQNITTWANTSVMLSTESLNASQAARFRTNPNGGGGLFTLLLLAIIIALAVLYYNERKRSGRPLFGKKKQVH